MSDYLSWPDLESRAHERTERDWDEPIDWNRITQDELIDNEEEYEREQ